MSDISIPPKKYGLRILIIMVFLFAFVLSMEIENSKGIGELNNVAENLVLVDGEQSDYSDSAEITELSTIVNNLEDDDVNGKKTIKEETPFVLPHSVNPLHYKLEIIPLLFSVEDVNSPYYNLTRFRAPGKVWIQFTCSAEISNITLHAYQDMIIKSEKIQITKIGTNATIPVKNITRDNDTDFLQLNLFQPICNESGNVYSVFIEFIAIIADDRLNGLYLDYYIDPKSKEKRYLSTTLFAPNHARKAFPCFDEPGFKANFSIAIGRKNDSGYSSVSNMPLSNTMAIPEINGWVWDEFEETLPLPTYLVALITTDFAFRSIKDGDLELRLHAPEYLIKRIKTLNSCSLAERSNVSSTPDPYLLQDPLHFIAAALKMWKGTKLGFYPLRKMDVVALPHFYFNAMENMGAVTFKYPVILNVENITTTSELLRLSFVAGHEVAHQWFGNMLTPKNWTYVWLKESFSDLFARLYLSKIVAPFDKHGDFLNNELQRALRFDGNAETHPLENHITTASSVGEIYTDIPYRKGASIMKMAKHFLSDIVFMEGLETLFKEKKYSNIDQYDLFDHLEKSQQKHHILRSQGLDGNTSVTDILNTWTKQSGYPVVRVRREGPKLILKQEKYKNGLLIRLKSDENETNMDPKDSTISPSLDKVGTDETQQNYWWIPIPLYRTVGALDKRLYTISWLHPHNEESEILLREFYFITNVEGYFRILYEKNELHVILKDLMKKYASGTFGAYYIDSDNAHSLPALERSQLLDDYFTFAFSKYDEVPVSLLFHIISIILPHEGDLVVWKTFFQNIDKPYKLLQNTEYFLSFKEYLIKLLRPIYAFLSSQKPSIFSAPCFHSSALRRRMQFAQFSSTVLSWICAIYPESCGDAAKKDVQIFMKTESVFTIPADYQETTYCVAVKDASEDEISLFWSFFEKMYFQEYFPVQRDRYLKALSCTRNRALLQRLLSWTTNNTLDFHDVDRVTLIRNVIANPEGREIILDFLNENFDTLYKSASVANPVTEALKAFVGYINSADKLHEMENFLKNHSGAMEKNKRFVDKQIKNAKLNILWMKTFANDIRESSEYHSKNTFVTNRPPCLYESVFDFDEYISTITDWS